MGRRNHLVEGVSTSGKTSVCHELRRRGVHAVSGDTDLASQGDPETGEPWTPPGRCPSSSTTSCGSPASAPPADPVAGVGS